MSTTDKASHLAHDAVDQFTKTAHQVEEVLGEKGEQLKNAEQHLVENCRGYIRDNPITSLGIAAAAGFLLSRLLSSR